MIAKPIATPEVRAKLKNYAYIMGLKELSPAERLVLERKYWRYFYKDILTGFSRIKSSDDIKPVFARLASQIENIIVQNNVIRCVVRADRYGIALSGVQKCSNEDLIFQHQTYMKNQKYQIDAQRRDREANKKRQRLQLINSCASDKEAKAVISKLKKKFKTV